MNFRRGIVRAVIRRGGSGRRSFSPPTVESKLPLGRPTKARFSVGRQQQKRGFRRDLDWCELPRGEYKGSTQGQSCCGWVCCRVMMMTRLSVRGMPWRVCVGETMGISESLAPWQRGARATLALNKKRPRRASSGPRSADRRLKPCDARTTVGRRSECRIESAIGGSDARAGLSRSQKNRRR